MKRIFLIPDAQAMGCLSLPWLWQRDLRMPRADQTLRCVVRSLTDGSSVGFLPDKNLFAFRDGKLKPVLGGLLA